MRYEPAHQRGWEDQHNNNRLLFRDVGKMEAERKEDMGGGGGGGTGSADASASICSSPFMTFLKAGFSQGIIKAGEARNLIEDRRHEQLPKRKTTTSRKVGGNFEVDDYVNNEELERYKGYLLARELAYVIRKSNHPTKADAQTVLLLYLESAKSLRLAVSYAESNKTHSVMLWNKIVSFCLDSVNSTAENIIDDHSSSSASTSSWSLFGALLEAAAQCGADLANLVSQIPDGMRIDGLRQMLVAAVSDYRMLLKMHEDALDVSGMDKVSIMRELAHRSRRGSRVPPGGGMMIGSGDGRGDNISADAALTPSVAALRGEPREQGAADTGDISQTTAWKDSKKDKPKKVSTVSLLMDSRVQMRYDNLPRGSRRTNSSLKIPIR